MNSEHTSGACECCIDAGAVTPELITNVPGQPALAWRVGTFASFKHAMLQQISRTPSLRSLTTREDSDPAIALSDAWSVALDVLTFYQERIANEHYLRTAVERRSVLELARAIGYELAPGVSASTYLAFQVEFAATATVQTGKIPTGTKVQSIPGHDEKPQLYETSDDLEARSAWGVMPAKRTISHPPSNGDVQLYLAGVSTKLRIGDDLLIATNKRLGGTQSAGWELRKVNAVSVVTEVDPARSYTLVTLDAKLSALDSNDVIRVFALRQRTAIFGSNAMSWPALAKIVKADYKGLSDPEKLVDEDLVEWPAWSIYSPSGAFKAGQEYQFQIDAEVQHVANAARNAISKEVANATQRASSSAQSSVMLMGSAAAKVHHAVQTSIQTVLNQLTSGFSVNVPSPAGSDDAISNIRKNVEEKNWKEAINGLMNSIQNIGSSTQDTVKNAFSAAKDTIQNFPVNTFPEWMSAGTQAGAALQSILESSKHSASVLGAAEAATVIQTVIEAAMHGTDGPPSIDRLKSEVEAAALLGQVGEHYRNALGLVASSGVILHTVAANFAGGAPDGGLNMDISQFANVQVHE